MSKVQISAEFAMNVDIHAGLVPEDTLFLHGNLASNTWWEPALALWKKDAKPTYKGRLIFGEWRGCGKSDPPRKGADLHPREMANDYIALLRSTNINRCNRCNLVAHSTGGIIALYALLKAPELFHRVVLLDPVGATGVKFEAPMYDAFTAISKDRALCATVMNGTIHGNDPASPLFQRIVDDAFGVAPLNWHGVPDALKNIDITAELPRITQPTLVLHGEHDPVLPREDSVALTRHMKNARFVDLKGQGHSANVENPQLFVNIVNDFLFTATA